MSKLKSSIEFKNQVDGFLKEVEENYLPKKDFVLENVRIMRYENIQKLFTENTKFPLAFFVMLGYDSLALRQTEC